MKNFVKSVVILAVLVVAFGSAGAVFAQSPEAVSVPSEYARGGRGGSGGGTGWMGQEMNLELEGILHDALVAAFADALDLPVEEINARLEDEETMAEIAISTGMTLDEFQTLMDEVLQQAVDQAVEDGLLTEAQAEWFLARGARMYGGAGMYSGMEASTRRSAGRGQSGTGTCLEE